MKQGITIALALYLAGCHHLPPPSHPEHIDEPLRDYVWFIEKKIGIEVDVEIRMGELTDGRRGRCNVPSGRITIDEAAFDGPPELTFLIILHEIGHCQYGILRHNNSLWSALRPTIDESTVMRYRRDPERFHEDFRERAGLR